MQDLGYVERRNIDYAPRYAEGDLTRMPALATELLHYKPAVFVTGISAGVRAVQEATATVRVPG
jgi:hypothetical protein